MKKIGAEAHAAQFALLLVIKQLSDKGLIDTDKLKSDLSYEASRQTARYPELDESLQALLARID